MKKDDRIYVEFSEDLEVIYFKRSTKVIHCFLCKYSGNEVEEAEKLVYEQIEDIAELIDDIIFKTKDAGKEKMKKQFDDTIPEYKIFKRRKKLDAILKK